MSKDPPFERPPSNLETVAVVSDRYGGAYSGGQWLAIAGAGELVYDPSYDRKTSRFALVLNEGPSGGEGDAMSFWVDPPEWIASGESPDEAVRNLYLGVRPLGWGSE